MTDVIQFIPQKNLTAVKNLKLFIEHCRERIEVFGRDLDFDSNRWDISRFISLRGKRQQKFSLVFGRPSGKSNHSGVITPFLGNFLDFTKAYVRYTYAISPTVAIMQLSTPFNSLDKVLNGKSITLLNQNDLNLACYDLKIRLSADYAYGSGARLEKMFDFLISKDLLATKFQWKNPNNKDSWSKGRVGKEADMAREKKMPTQTALNAVAEVFRLAKEPRDVLISSIVAIMCSAPERISEVLELPFDCEVMQPETNGMTSYGIRWWPAKGGAPQIKWIVPTMVEVVKEAIGRIKRVTAEAREIARWYEKYPTCVFLPDEYEYVRMQDELSVTEVEGIIGIRAGGGASFIRTLLGKSKMPARSEKSNKNMSYIKFSDFERLIIEMLPKTFPYLDKERGIRYSDALFLCKKNECHSQRPTYRCLIQSVSTNLVNGNLGSRGKHGNSSIFTSHNLTEQDGSPISVTSHQFRHYLNTLAQHGGMSDVDIAKWSGRLNIRQNEVYDHVSSREMLQIIRGAIGNPSKAVGPLATLKNQSLIKRDDFERLIIPTAHTTDIGFCVHDYTMSPCEVHMDCLNCQEMVCIKGDRVAERNIKIALDESSELLKRARLAKSDQDYGADRWVDHHQANHERLSQLNNILHNQKIANGTVIQLDRPRKKVLERKKILGGKSD